MGTESKAETMDTQDGMLAKDAGLAVLQPAQPGAGSAAMHGMTERSESTRNETGRRKGEKGREGELVQLHGGLLLSGFVRVTLLIRREGCRDVWYSTLAGAFRCHRLLLSSAPCSAIDFPMRSPFRSIRRSQSRWEFRG